MKSRLRLMLPPLAEMSPQSRIPWALLDRNGAVRRSGEVELQHLGHTVAARRVEAVLQPGDAIVIDVQLPPLPARRLDAAVQARVEPMALSPLEELCIAHGPARPDGSVAVAWADRSRLMAAWRMLADAGLKVDALFPLELILPDRDTGRDQPLTLPADERWQAPSPRWSLARREWQPASNTQRWHGPLRWMAAAAVLWLAGLQLYAGQLRDEVRLLERGMETAVRGAFPAISVILDPLRQARGHVDQLRLAQGRSSPDDFMPLMQATARVLGFASGHVASLHYDAGRLTLTLTEGYAPPSDETALQRNAAAERLLVQKDDAKAHVWHIARIDTVSTSEVRR